MDEGIVLPSATAAGHPQFARKYGRNYEYIDSSISSLGYKELGKVKVDVRFRKEDCMWGVMGEEQNPAGIIYMDLSFDQPKSCYLERAIVTVTLEGDRSLRFYNGLRWHRNILHMTDSYGPKYITGQPTTAMGTKSYQLVPDFNLLNVGIGGVDATSEKTIPHTSRWTFTGNLQPERSAENGGVSRGTAYRTIKWELTEDELAQQSIHSPLIHTAFAFEYSANAFYLHIDIQGNLRKRSQQLKETMRSAWKFPGSADKEQGTATTLVAVKNPQQYTRPLDTLAQGLANAMAMKNYEEIGMKVPDPVTASFQEITPETTTANTLENKPTLERTGLRTGIQESRLADNPSTELITKLSRAVDEFCTEERRVRDLDTPRPSRMTTGVTKQPIEPLSSAQDDGLSQAEFDMLMQNPLVRIFIHMLASLFAFFSFSSPATNAQPSAPPRDAPLPDPVCRTTASHTVGANPRRKGLVIEDVAKGLQVNQTENRTHSVHTPSHAL